MLGMGALENEWGPRVLEKTDLEKRRKDPGAGEGRVKAMTGEPTETAHGLWINS